MRHIFRKHPSSDCAVTLGWIPLGRSGRGRQKIYGRKRWKKKEIRRADHPGSMQEGWLGIENGGGNMSMPYKEN